MDRLAVAAVGVGQDHLQATGLNVLVGHEVRQTDDALAFQRQLTQGLATGCSDVGTDQPAVTLGMTQRPVVEAFGLGEPQQGMGG